MENPESLGKVDKVVICIGTNEIKFFNSNAKSVSKCFGGALSKLVEKIRTLFYNAQIIFQSILPIRIIYKYTVKSVHLFNRLLIEICQKFGCLFFDCFSDFLDRNEWDINLDLYRDKKLHLNERGVGVLCRALKFIIYNNVYCPVTKFSCSPYFYTNY